MGKKYLVVIDVPGIKKYVFGTDRLVEIRGANGLLAQVNEHETPAFLEDNLGKSRVNCIFSGGGAGQFIIDVDFQNPMKACCTQDLSGNVTAVQVWGHSMLNTPVNQNCSAIFVQKRFVLAKKRVFAKNSPASYSTIILILKPIRCPRPLKGLVIAAFPEEDTRPSYMRTAMPWES